jgi:hypothetical protein
MDTQKLKTDKLDLMDWIYSIQDAAIIETLKEIKKTAVLSAYERSLKPMTKAELVSRAESANKAISNNETTSQEALRNEVKNW